MNAAEAAGTDFVQEHLAKSSAWLAGVWQRQQDAYLRAFRSSVQSPIEAAFLIWWSAIEKAYATGPEIEVYPQHEVTVDNKKYRVDFALTPGLAVVNAAEKRSITYTPVAVELDGHEFHERTKEQVAYRNERDRALQSAGWTVLHFSGSEMHRDPVNCVQQAMEHASRSACALIDAVIAAGGYAEIYTV